MLPGEHLGVDDLLEPTERHRLSSAVSRIDSNLELLAREASAEDQVISLMAAQ